MSQLTIECLTQEGTPVQTVCGQGQATLHIDAYAPGAQLAFEAEGNKYIWVQIHRDVKESMLYIPGGRFVFPIPSGQALRGFAPGTFDGPQTVSVREATEQERYTYRNLCLNTLDWRLPSEVVDPDAPEWSNPTNSKAMANGEVACFPHAYANRVTRNEGSFFARNAIDGIATQNGHGDYPYHSWGGAVHEDLSFTVYFGREIETDKIVLYLRSDYSVNSRGQEHDTYWHTAVIECSDGSEFTIHPQKTGDAQVFSFAAKRTEWVKFKRMDPMQIPESENFAALNQFEVWGTDVK